MSTRTSTWAVPRYLIEDTLAEAGIDGEDAAIRASYEGRGPSTTGFGVTLRHTRDLARFMFYLGMCAGVADAEDDEVSYSPLERMAKVVAIDTMGLGLIAYFPGVELSD